MFVVTRSFTPVDDLQTTFALSFEIVSTLFKSLLPTIVYYIVYIYIYIYINNLKISSDSL